MKRQFCVVCDTEITRAYGRCTNRCCNACHRKYCTPGDMDNFLNGVTSPGHNLDIKAAKARHKKQVTSNTVTK